MPNQDSTQDPQNIPQAPPVVPVDVPNSMPVHNDLPPLPPDFQNVPDAIPPVDQSAEGSGSAAPADLPPMIGTPKKKFGGKKIIATILGIFLLVGGVGTGVYLVNQQQTANSKAGQIAVTNAITGKTEYISNDAESLASYRATLANNDIRAEIIDAQQESRDSQAAQSSSSNECGGAGQKECKVVCENGTCHQGNVTFQEGSTSTGTSFSYGCGSGYYACNVGCCGIGGTPSEGTRFYPGSSVTWNASTPYKNMNAEQQADYTAALKLNGLQINNNGTVVLTTNTVVDSFLEKNPTIKNYCYSDGTLNTSKCTIVTGGYLYIGGSRVGTACAPCLTCGADWCQIIGGTGKTCSSLGLIRCICGNSVGVIGSDGQSCDNLCGGTNNVCESCTTTTTTTSSTPTPGPSAVCQNVKAFNETGGSIALTSAELAALKSGSVVTFCAFGTTTTGSFDQAKFTINSVEQPIVNATEFAAYGSNLCQAYTIPSDGTKTFNVIVQLHHSTLGWVQ